MNGIFIINKPPHITSRDVVNKISKKFHIKKVGHTGTLDPLATGVLIVCVGSATKLVNELTSEYKEYVATAILGLSTDTLDIEGKILKDSECIKNKDEIINALNKFKGSYDQEVPKYSAIKINGKKLYEYAREGVEISLPTRNVNIKSIELIDEIKYENNKTIFKFKCLVSKGTYIRSLIRDIGNSLNTEAIMKELVRTKQGKFSIENAKNLDDIAEKDLISIKDVLDLPTVEVKEEYKKKILNGCKIENIFGENKILFTYNNQEIGIYMSENDYLKPYIMFKGGNI